MAGGISLRANQSSLQQKERPASFPYPEPLLDGSVRSKHFQRIFIFFRISFDAISFPLKYFQLERKSVTLKQVL